MRSTVVPLLSFCSALLMPWKSPLIMVVTSIGSFHETLPFLGLLLTCLGVVLCMQDCFLEPPFSSTVLSPAWDGSVLFAVVYCAALSMSGLQSVVGTFLHEHGGSPDGHLTSVRCGGGGSLPLVASECCGQLVHGLVWADCPGPSLLRKGQITNGNSPRISNACFFPMATLLFWADGGRGPFRKQAIAAHRHEYQPSPLLRVAITT